jgi:HSP20 family protein
MPIVRWEPFRELVTTQDQLNQLLNSALGQAFGERDVSRSSEWAPLVDVIEGEQSVTVNAELPGIDPQSVDIRVQDNTLYLKGERNLERQVKQGQCYRLERLSGSFARSLSLPVEVNADAVTANYKDGVLSIALPKKEAAKPKSIKINVVQ